ncbi:MAG: hypothetical protein AB1705_16840 [Verrucomicrobiota bacterium]
MADPAKAELMHSLRRLVRGLSALFWGLPITLLVCVQSAVTEWLKPLGAAPPILATGFLFYGLTQLEYFQKQERVWVQSIERTKVFALINVGLSPFIFWWSKMPHEMFFGQVVGLLALSGLLFLFNLNQLLQRLSAMLPDETVRAETRLFTTVNLYLMLTVVILMTFYFALEQVSALPQFLIQLLDILAEARRFLLLFLVLMPLAMTMTLVWKIKEVVLSSVFGAER